jgi:hypothetical protein
MLGPAEDAPAGSSAWAERISKRLQTTTDSLSRDTVHHLERCIRQIWETQPRPWEVWPEGSPLKTPDDYCKAVTGHPWKALISIVKEMGGEQLRFEEMLGELARAQAKHRKRGRPKEQKPYVVRNISEKGGDGGNSSGYLLRRLSRDHPEVLQRYERREFKSVRAAAKAAGIMKTKTPFEMIKTLITKHSSKLSDDEREELRQMLE